MRCPQCQAQLYRRIGERTKGDEHLATAITMYREMDMTFWLEKAAALTPSGS